LIRDLSLSGCGEHALTEVQTFPLPDAPVEGKRELVHLNGKSTQVIGELFHGIVLAQDWYQDLVCAPDAHVPPSFAPIPDAHVPPNWVMAATLLTYAENVTKNSTRGCHRSVTVSCRMANSLWVRNTISAGSLRRSRFP
jgi:hypothetical protein